MADGLQLSARSVASLLARILGPAIYDAPPFGGGDLARPDWRRLIDVVAGPHPEPWRAVMLNPQPLPPREAYAFTLADAHLRDVLALDRLGAVFGEQVAERTLEQSLRLVTEIDDLCPRWPRWPKGWPPPPPPPWEGEEMTPTALFVFGMRFLAASELPAPGRLQEALTGLGEKALSLSLPG
jgi:hypothetical protein